MLICCAACLTEDNRPVRNLYKADAMQTNKDSHYVKHVTRML